MKNKVLWLIILSGLFITGCKTGKFTAGEKNCEFTGNKSSGYTWISEVGDTSVIDVDETIHYLGYADVAGAPSLYQYTIRALKPGNTTLRFEYKRPWERKSAKRVWLYRVKVSESGIINMKCVNKSFFS